ncbi:rhodanese-like domain-containing protein [Marinoscillum furvescens]|uniref:Rhodanese-related sulfurtransferase n=1 Tax=Marinoscillum furvescens DSM 4134 TaxID=1122208 RepID=A0A3D9L4T8_MARFU|nr:rhodanese-like domain-containing protein [Marinoscillum furvescens]RED99424.1 rhodanese-related sulfurtransferase [Marinoscillum furvescens DSM 4134]
MHRLWIFLLSLAWLPACDQKTFDEKMQSLYSQSVPLITHSELQSLLKKPELHLLDTREKREFDVSHLPNALWVGFKDFSLQRVANLSKDDTVVVYCSVGYRSERIGEKLRKAGYQNVFNLYGGIFDWKNKNNRVINNQNEPTDSVHTYNKKWSQWLYKGTKVYE